MSTPSPVGTASHPEIGKKVYQGPIFDCDSHIYELNYDFMKDYLPKALQPEWLPARKVGPDGRFGLHIGDRMVEFYNQGKPKEVTFEHGKATQIKDKT